MKKTMLASLALLTACSGSAPQNIGVRDGRLVPCPESPNCVSSFETTESHAIEPIAGTLEEIESVLLTMDRVNIVRAEENYIRADFTSRIMRFVDDVEFFYDPVKFVTHVRSASRVGYSDMGVNRKRIETIRAAVAQLQNQ